MVFGVSGLGFATWAARLPAIRDKLDLNPERIGFLLLFMSVGSVLTLTMAGAIVRRLGPARTIVCSAVVAMSGLAILGLAPSTQALAVGLVMTGSGVGAWDVAMNVEGADVERRLGRAIMPRFHAAFSLGTVTGAGVGALAALAEVPVEIQLPVVAVIVLAAAWTSVRWFLPVDPGTRASVDGASRDVVDPAATQQVARELWAGDQHAAPGAPAADRGVVPGRSSAALGGQLDAWTDPATLLIGVLVFSMALAEGSANDWLALSVVDGYGAVHAVGALALGVFVVGMTSTRMAGPYLLARFDNVLVLRLSALLVLAGTGLLIAGAIGADGAGSPLGFLVAAVAALLWGLGAALGFPMGMSAAAADPARAATRVGVVSTIGYTAFIAGPPLLGSLGEHIGTAQSMVAVSGAVLLALVTAQAVRPAAPVAGPDGAGTSVG